ncbi:MAG: TIR domain-containing protein [Gammaproteobacteria bacterium]
MTGPSTTPALFISYARADRMWVDRFAGGLERNGYSYWMDTSDIQGGDDWLGAISAAIEGATVFITIVSAAANRSAWVRLEFLRAKNRGKRIIPLLADGAGLPWYMADKQALDLHGDYDADLARLIEGLAALPAVAPVRTETARDLELAYLRRLQLGELVHTELYTPMAGAAHIHKRETTTLAMPSVVMRPEFEHLRHARETAKETPTETQRREDITKAVLKVPRAVLLGEPGAGKTTTLWKLARDTVECALVDGNAPIPLLIRLGNWTDPRGSLVPFMRHQLV